MFWFRLAKELGKSVRQAQQEISSSEFTEWQAYYQMEPFGEAVADLRHGVATALQANVHYGSESKRFQADDFINWRPADAAGDDAEPILLADPAAQGQLMRAAMFGKAPG